MHTLFFFCNDPAPTEIYTLSLHDALPIWPARLHRRRDPPLRRGGRDRGGPVVQGPGHHRDRRLPDPRVDRKSTRLNSSHVEISYAVFCLKKKKNTID